MSSTANLVPLGSNTDLVHRRRICPKPIGDDAARSPVFLHDPLEKLQRRGFVSLRGSHRFQDLALMVDGAPQIAELAVDLHEHLVQMPAPLRIAAHVRDASLPNLGGEHWAKTVPPESDGLVADVDPTLGQQILDVAQRQRVSHVHHHHQTDHLWRAVEISEWIAHAPRLTHPAVREFALTPPTAALFCGSSSWAWFAFLDESEAILEGRRLAPHWRFAKGIDVKAFFEKPQSFDVVLFVTGQGALPYLADGPITSPERWARIIRAFEGNFFQFAVWFN